MLLSSVTEIFSERLLCRMRSVRVGGVDIRYGVAYGRCFDVRVQYVEMDEEGVRCVLSM